MLQLTVGKEKDFIKSVSVNEIMELTRKMAEIAKENRLCLCLKR